MLAEGEDEAPPLGALPVLVEEEESADEEGGAEEEPALEDMRELEEDDDSEDADDDVEEDEDADDGVWPEADDADAGALSPAGAEEEELRAAGPMMGLWLTVDPPLSDARRAEDRAFWCMGSNSGELRGSWRVPDVKKEWGESEAEMAEGEEGWIHR